MIRRLFCALALLCSLTSCINSRPAAAQKGSKDIGCPENVLTVRDLEDDRYEVSGCHKSAVYECRESECWREGLLAIKAVQRASREFACPSHQVEVHWIQEDTYRVEACGQAATYSCNNSNCVPEGARPPTPVIFHRTVQVPTR